MLPRMRITKSAPQVALALGLIHGSIAQMTDDPFSLFYTTSPSEVTTTGRVARGDVPPWYVLRSSMRDIDMMRSRNQLVLRYPFRFRAAQVV